MEVVGFGIGIVCWICRRLEGEVLAEREGDGGDDEWAVGEGEEVESQEEEAADLMRRGAT